MNRIEDVYGLTPVQEGIYAQYFQKKETRAYHLYYLFSVDNALDPVLLRQALELLPMRHPVLKTAFAVADGTVKQALLADRKPMVVIRDLNSVFDPDTLEKAVNEEKKRPLDLTRDTLVRCVIFAFSNAHFLFLHTHHMIMDGWSAGILFEDLAAFCRALGEGEPADALKARIAAQRAEEPSFAEYVNMIRRRDRGSAFVYWKRLLEGSALARLPKLRSSDHTSGAILRTSLTVPADVARKIRAFARQNALPVNALLESVFALTLHKHAGTKDAVFFKVISGRSFAAAGSERTVGPMINTVPVRARRTDGQTLRQFLNEMNEQAANAGEYGFLSLSEVCRIGGMDPSADGVLFDYGNTPAPAAGDGVFRLLEQQEQTEFPLTCVITPAESSFLMSLTYHSAVFSSVFVRSFSDSFLFMLRCLSEAAEGESDEPSFFSGLLRLTPAEHALIFGGETEKYPSGVGFCAGERVPIPEQSVYALFSQRAAVCPKKTAVIFRERSYSYGEILLWVDEAADRLASVGVRAGDVVAVCLRRTPLLIVLQLAVLKLGAVFLPVDRRFPEKRVQFVCGDCGAALLITDGSVAAPSGMPVLTPEALAPGKENCPHVPETRGEDCYIIYTSGSTGAPKGCVLRQTGLVNFCINNNTLETLRNREINVFASVNSVSFDYFIAESLLPLLNGYTVVLCTEDESLLQRLFLDVVRKHGVNVLMTTPTRLSLFYDSAEDTAPLQALTCVCSSGEPLTEKLLTRIYGVSPLAKVYNPLGPSECTVWDLGGGLDRAAGSDIHLGLPVANTRIYILDESLRPVPVGVTGELCIAGAGVGAGYVNRPLLTAEKFTDDPYGEGKLYRTGDLVCWREDGSVSYIGRADSQLKLNGLRIEPGEIEAALSAQEGIEAAVVTVCANGSGEQTLLAFYTGAPAEESALREALSVTLPPYMIPHVFTWLENMPLTSSGKIDRLALKEISAQARPTAQTYVPPQTDSEKAVCAAFSAILNEPRVGRNADFFLLGGTSLQLVRLLSGPPLNKLTPSDFLKDPTPAGLAKMLDATQEKNDSYLVPLYTPAHAKKAFLLFPFAGGDAAAFTALVGKFRQRNSSVALYYVDWPERSALSAIAREIRNTAAVLPVFFYSHCAGACIALSLLDILNKNERVVRGYVAGAVIPPRKALAGFNMWAHLSDGAIEKALVSAGLRLDEDGGKTLRERLKTFREHTKISSAYFSNKTEKTNVSVTVVLSKGDPFTPKTADAGAHWERIVSNVDRVIVIDTPSHYFQNTDTDLLLELFSDIK